jgi:hypothetical protein
VIAHGLAEHSDRYALVASLPSISSVAVGAKNPM